MGLFDKLFRSDAAADSANSAWNILETDGDLDRLDKAADILKADRSDLHRGSPGSPSS